MVTSNQLLLNGGRNYLLIGEVRQREVSSVPELAVRGSEREQVSGVKAGGHVHVQSPAVQQLHQHSHSSRHLNATKGDFLLLLVT